VELRSTFFKFYSFHVFGSAKTLMAITCQHVTYLQAATQIGAKGY